MFNRSIVVVAASLFTLAGCCGAGAGDTRQTAPAPVPNTPKSLDVQIGGGESEFADEADGAEVELVHGPQGGWHVWTSVRVTPAVAELTVDLSANVEGETDPAGPASGWAANRMTSHDYVEVDGLKAYVTSPDAVVGRTLVIHADAVTPDGQHGSATLRVRVTSST
ncbi:MAG TPA: hypothetical protein VIF62_06320 [Labilithrix sp.]|jgi:hypothetical protein